MNNILKRCLHSTLSFYEVPKVMKVPLQGTYCSQINICAVCDGKSKSIFAFHHVVGIALNNFGETEMIWECPHCFEKNYYHLQDEIWDLFKNEIEANAEQFQFYGFENGQIIRK